MSRQLARAGSWVRAAWLMLGIALVLFVATESVLSVAFRWKDGPRRSAAGDDIRVDADAYPDSSWVEGCLRETRRADVGWRSYVYWRRLPFEGSWVRVDREGKRSTWFRAPADADRVADIFVFGGSTVWGTGVRDAHTIPSCLAREIDRRGVSCRVVNFGETGYVSTQEVLALLLELRRGNVPDLVVFYDGINDVFSAWQNRAAGLPQNESHRVAEFNLSNPERRRERTAKLLADFARGLALRRAADVLLRRAALRRETPADADSLSAPVEALARDVVDTYVGNVAIVRALADRYGFRCLFYWQPVMFEKAHLTPYERSQLQYARTMEPFFRRTFDLVQAGDVGTRCGCDFHDLSSLFLDVREPVFIDWCHVGESGNAAVARSMVEDVVGALAEMR